MPYQAYTNDSDLEFSRQQSDFKLGTSMHGGNDYEEANAVFNNMPEALAVGQLMRMRQSAQAADMTTRKAISEDQSLYEDQNDFRGYSDFVTGLKGMEPQARAERLAEAQFDNPHWTTNQQIQDSMAAIGTAGDQVAKSYGNRAAISRSKLDESATGLGQEVFDDTKEIQRESMMMDIQTGYDSSMSKMQDFDSLHLAEGNDRQNQFIQTVSGTNFDQSVKDKFIALAETIGYGNEGKGQMSVLTKLGKSLVMGEQVKQSMRHKTAEVQPLLDVLEKSGADLSDDASIRAMIATGRDPKRNAAMLSAYEKNKETILHYGEVSKNSAQISEFTSTEALDKLLAMAKTAQETGKWDDYNREAAVISGKASTIEGAVRANYDDQKREFEFAAEQRKAKAEELANLSKVSAMDNIDTDNARAMMKIRQDQKDKERTTINQTLRALVTDDKFKKLSSEKQQEQIDEIMSTFTNAQRRWAPAK
jgi:hypothetical protein